MTKRRGLEVRVQINAGDVYYKFYGINIQHHGD